MVTEADHCPYCSCRSSSLQTVTDKTIIYQATLNGTLKKTLQENYNVEQTVGVSSKGNSGETHFYQHLFICGVDFRRCVLHQ